jgi:hypothetical protein
MDTPSYQAGCSELLPITIVVRLSSSELTRNDLLARFIEFWCQSNCTRNWNVSEHKTCIIVGFDDAFDATMFKLSPESDLS